MFRDATLGHASMCVAQRLPERRRRTLCRSDTYPQGIDLLVRVYSNQNNNLSIRNQNMIQINGKSCRFRIIFKR